MCEEKDPDFVADFEEAELDDEEDNDGDFWQDAQDQPVVIIDDHFAEDFTEMIVKFAEKTFLPHFLDRIEKLDKGYPNVQYFIEDNAAKLDDVETIVRASCYFLKKST